MKLVKVHLNWPGQSRILKKKQNKDLRFVPCERKKENILKQTSACHKLN